MESKEWGVQAALRELYEETGAEISAIETIGQYTIYEDTRLTVVKNVYVAKVKEIHPLPEGFETVDIRLFKLPPTIEEIACDAQYSPLVKDQVYPRILEIIRNHPYAEGVKEE
ncbi:putative 8-oxo-dGTP diphosphatase YtkD [compost metagenome]